MRSSETQLFHYAFKSSSNSQRFNATKYLSLSYLTYVTNLSQEVRSSAESVRTTFQLIHPPSMTLRMAAFESGAPNVARPLRVTVLCLLITHAPSVLIYPDRRDQRQLFLGSKLSQICLPLPLNLQDHHWSGGPVSVLISFFQPSIRKENDWKPGWFPG